MKKVCFLLILVTQLCISQKNKLVVNNPKLKTNFVRTDFGKTELFNGDCEIGEKTAKIDFEKANYNVYTFGFSTYYKNKVDSLQKNFSKKNIL